MTRSFDLGIALTMTSVVAVALPTAARGDQEAGGVRIASQCAVQGFQSGSQTLDTPASIPDNTAEGITVGPIVLANGEFLVAEVVVDMSLSHTWVGDVIATLLYDQDSDGDYDVASSVLCRPGREGACNDLGNGDGCSANLLADQIERPLLKRSDWTSRKRPSASSTARSRQRRMAASPGRRRES